MTDKLTRIRELAEQLKEPDRFWPSAGFIGDELLAILNESEPAGAGPSDTQRLDWLENRKGCLVTYDQVNKWWMGGTKGHETMRAAIDADAAIMRGAAQPTPAEQPALDWTEPLVQEIADGLVKSASLLCETRGHYGRRPCGFCQMQIRACFPYAPFAVPAQPEGSKG